MGKTCSIKVKSGLSAIFTLLGAVFFFLSSVSHATDNSTPLSLSFGVYQSDIASVMYRQFSPILQHLNKNMAVMLARPVHVSLRIFKGYDQAIMAVVNGEVDFVRFGPVSYVLANNKNPKLQLIAKEETKGNMLNPGVIIVPTASQVHSLADLAGKRFAFGNENSTLGSYMPRGKLVDAGITASKLASYDFLGRHDKVFKVVALGKYDAGALKESTVNRHNKTKKVRVISRFSTVTKPWLAKAELPKNILDAIRESLFLVNKTMLKASKITGFLPVDDREYEDIRKAVRQAKRFNE